MFDFDPETLVFLKVGIIAIVGIVLFVYSAHVIQNALNKRLYLVAVLMAVISFFFSSHFVAQIASLLYA